MMKQLKPFLPHIAIGLVLFTAIGLFISKTRQEVRSQEFFVVNKILYSGNGSSVVASKDDVYLTVPGYAKEGDKIEVNCAVSVKQRHDCHIENHGH